MIIMAQRVESGSCSNQKVDGSIPVYPMLCADVSLGKILNPKLPILIERMLHIDAQYECVR